MKPEDRERFFFAEAAAQMYDRTIDLVVPQYRVMHDDLVRHLRDHLAMADPRHLSSATGTVLDVGAGTGIDTMRVLREFPSIRVVAIDLCEPMCAELRNKLRSPSNGVVRAAQRCAVVCGDVLSDMGEPVRLKRHLSSDQRTRGYRAVLTSLTVHHFEHHEKQEFYSRMCQALEPGGILLNADLFSYASKDLADAALAFDLEWMQKQFASPDPAFVEGQTLPSAERERLSHLWRMHYLLHNRLEPIEDVHCEKETLKGMATMLKDAGFREVSVTYRFSLSGILWARK